MATCSVMGTLVDASEVPVQGAVVKFNITVPYFNGSLTNFFVPKEVSVTSAADGTWALNLSKNISGVITIEYPPNSTDSSRRANYSVIIPNANTASFSSIVTEL